MSAHAAEIEFGANSKQVIEAINGISKKLSTLKQQGSKSTEPIGAGLSTATKAGLHFKAALTGLSFAGLAVGAAKAFGVVKDSMLAAVSTAAEFEQYEVRFETLLGSADKASAHVAKLREYAASTPFDLAGISKASAALVAFGVDAEQSHDVLRMLGDVAAAAGVPLEQLAEIVGKTNTVGVLDRGDVNQLSIRGLNVRELLAQRDGISVQEVNKNVSAGRYNIKDLLEILKTATSEGGRFFGGAAKQSRTLKGLWSTLGDSIKDVQASIGKLYEGSAKKFLQKSIEMVEVWGGPLQGAVKDLGVLLYDIGRHVVGLADVATLGGLSAIIGSFKELAETERQINKLYEERKELIKEPLFKTGVQLQQEREAARLAQIKADAEERAAKVAEKQAAAAERAAKAKQELTQELRQERAKRAENADRDMFKGQNAAGMRAELAYRFFNATGKSFSEGGADEAELTRAENRAARAGNTAAVAELRLLREYITLYKEKVQLEVEEANAKQAALDAARDSMTQEAMVHDAQQRGDMAEVQRLQGADTAEKKYQELLALGMPPGEAARYAAEYAGRQHGATGSGSGAVTTLSDSMAAIGGGGTAVRIPSAQLAVQRQQLQAEQLTNVLLQRLIDKYPTAGGAASIPVTL